MIKLNDLTEKQRNQFEMFLRAEGFKIKIPELKEDPNITHTIFIKDNELSFINDQGKKEIVYRFIDYTNIDLEKEINNKDKEVLQFFNKNTKIKKENLKNFVCPYFLFSFLNNENLIILINLKEEEVKKFYLCQLCSLINFLKGSFNKTNEEIYKLINCFLIENEIYKYPSCPKDLDNILKALLNL